MEDIIERPVLAIELWVPKMEYDSSGYILQILDKERKTITSIDVFLAADRENRMLLGVFEEKGMKKTNFRYQIESITGRK